MTGAAKLFKVLKLCCCIEKVENDSSPLCECDSFTYPSRNCSENHSLYINGFIMLSLKLWFTIINEETIFDIETNRCL